MDLNRELYDRIQETSEAKIFHIGNQYYSTEKLHLIEEPVYKPDIFYVNTLNSLAVMIETEVDKIKELPLIVGVGSHYEVQVYTTYDSKFGRPMIYKAKAEAPRLYSIDNYMGHEEFMIELRSKFVRNDDVSYLLTLLASVVDENSVKSSDNGVSQKVEVRQGITTIGEMPVRPIVSLAPYRTFLEVEQPESEFLVRLKEGGKIALFEADGGMWKLEAKRKIAEYLRNRLKGMIEAGSVVVTE